MKMYPALQPLGVRFIAVGNGSQLFAKKFKASVFKDGEVYIDSESKAFQQASLPRMSIWATLKRFIFNTALFPLFKQFSNIYPESDIKGDGQQTGGVFVVGPGEGPVKYSFIEFESEPTSFADQDAIYAACGGQGDWKSICSEAAVSPASNAPASSSSSSSSSSSPRQVSEDLAKPE